MPILNEAYLKEKYGRQLSTAEKLTEVQKRYDMLWVSYEKAVQQRDDMRKYLNNVIEGR